MYIYLRIVIFSSGKYLKILYIFIKCVYKLIFYSY
nr:MAG TPA: hypothetical protein [Caudoviricetes sp.]